MLISLFSLYLQGIIYYDMRKTRLLLLMTLLTVATTVMGQNDANARRQVARKRGASVTRQTTQQPVQQPVQAQQPQATVPTTPPAPSNIKNQGQYDQYIEAAKKGDAAAELKVAQSHQFPSEGYFYWLKRSAEHGDHRAQNVLAYCYSEGQGIAQNKKLAFDWWLKSAEQGNAASQGAVGAYYLNGVVVPKNEEKAYYWYQKGAAQNDVHSLVMMGFAYEGKGIIPEDPVKSFECFKKAAELGSDMAEPQVAFRYFYGDGVAQDYGQAAYWFEKCIARGGDPEDIQYWKEFLDKAKMRQQIKDKQKK